jgi:hypothetical protein
LVVGRATRIGSLRLCLGALLACGLLALCSACGAQTGTKVLFIGNSFTAYNGGIDAQLAAMAPGCRTQLLAPGGYTLQKHWDDPGETAAIRSGHFNYVVILRATSLDELAEVGGISGRSCRGPC